MHPDGSCPTCGAVLDLPPPRVCESAEARAPEEEVAHPKAPWHFKVLLSVLVVYLAWRGVQGIEWVARHI